jgi:hypothetical protein
MAVPSEPEDALEQSALASIPPPSLALPHADVIRIWQMMRGLTTFAAIRREDPTQIKQFAVDKVYRHLETTRDLLDGLGESIFEMLSNYEFASASEKTHSPYDHFTYENVKDEDDLVGDEIRMQPLEFAIYPSLHHLLFAMNRTFHQNLAHENPTGDETAWLDFPPPSPYLKERLEDPVFLNRLCCIISWEFGTKRVGERVLAELTREFSRALVTRRCSNFRFLLDDPALAIEGELGEQLNQASKPTRIEEAELFIREKGPVKGLRIANELDIDIKTFHKHYAPKLRERGMQNDRRGGGYYYPKSGAPTS